MDDTPPTTMPDANGIAAINSLVMAVTANPDQKAETLRELARAVWWAGYNAATANASHRDMALDYAIQATSAESMSIVRKLRAARTFEAYLAGELGELPVMPATPKTGQSEVKAEVAADDEASALLKRLGLD